MGALQSLIFYVILVLPFAFGNYTENGTRILKILSKSAVSSINTTLDELLSKNPISSAVYFNEAKVEDSRDGLDSVSKVVFLLTDLPDILDVFLINCKRSINKKDCSNYDYKAPGLRFFTTQFNRLELKKGDPKGLAIPNDEPSKMQKALLEALYRELNKSGRLNFKPVLETDSIASLFTQKTSKNMSFVVLVGQAQKASTLGSDTIMALLSKKQLTVRIVDNLNVFRNFGLNFKKLNDTLVIIPWSGRLIKLSPKEANGNEFAKAVLRYLNDHRISQVSGSRIIRVWPKGKYAWINKNLDDLLSQSSVSNLIYFTQSKLGDKTPLINMISHVLVPLTELPRILEIYLVNCTRWINNNDCTNYGFKQPQLRFFPNAFKRVQGRSHDLPQGLVIANDTPYKMRNSVMNALTRVQLKTPGAPNFQPILSTDTVTSLFKKAACKCILYLVLVGQTDKGSTVGRDTVMALLRKENIMVRIVTNHTFFENFGLKFLRRDNKLALIPRSRRVVKLYPKRANGVSFASTVINYLEDFF